MQSSLQKKSHIRYKRTNREGLSEVKFSIPKVKCIQVEDVTMTSSHVLVDQNVEGKLDLGEQESKYNEEQPQEEDLCLFINNEQQSIDVEVS